MKSVARLYTSFQPDHYDLALSIDEEAMRFSGTVMVTGKKVGRPSKRLTFHANGLKVTSGKITVQDKKGSREISVARINHQKTLNEVRLHAEEMLFPGSYKVQMCFEAPITDGMTGIYPCYFKDGDETKKLFATQFESHHAREAFPCIDEPEAKATFKLTIHTESDVTVLSNTPVESESDADNRRTTSFEITPKMSTYLLAFAYGDIHSKSGKTASGVEVKAWSTSVQPINNLDFALDAAIKSIEFFEDYFGVPYPLAKADHIALPDFSSGAMENWGLITYRERVFLSDPQESSQSTKEYVALVIAHETSHQWFGNLVTMKWWDNLWLNESFANMMEYQCVNAMFPEWNVWDSFVSNEALSALRRDATFGVQAVQTGVHHPDEISTLFDPSIVYAKGGRLLYMLKNYIGEEAFRKGLSAYFKTHAYGNTTGDDLWAALGAASGKDIGTFMNPWLLRSGFPVVHVEQDGKQITLTQEQFLDDPTKADKTRVWPVPTFASNEQLTDVLHVESRRYTLSSAEPVYLNTHGRGHYIVHYRSQASREALARDIAKQSVSEADRLLVLTSSSMLARSGYASYDETLGLLSAYATEASDPVWDSIATVLGEVRRFIDHDASLEAPIKQLSGSVAALQLERLGWEPAVNETAADTKLRATVIGLSAYAEVPSVIERCKEMFTAYVDKGEKLPADLRAIVMAVAVKQQWPGAFEFLLKQHTTTNNSELQGDLADGLTATMLPEQASTLLARLKDKNLVKPQDVDRWLVYLLRNRYTRETAWQWMVDNWSWLQETFKNDKSYDYLPRYAATCVNTDEYIQKFHDLFADKVDQPLLKRNIELGMEEIAARVAWLKRDLAGVQRFFKDLQ